MQQTEKYQLNLIETSDPFSPAPLNENAQKLEAALTTVGNAAAASDAAEAAARAAGDAALDQRLQVFEAKRLAVGTYNPQSSGPMDINLGFTPFVVFCQALDAGSVLSGCLMTEYETYHGKIIPNGFQISRGADTGTVNNMKCTFGYIALG